MNRAPAERKVPGRILPSEFLSLRWSEEDFFELRFHKHGVPPTRRKLGLENWQPSRTAEISSCLTAALESRNDEQTATDCNQVLEQSNGKIWQVQRSHKPSAGLIARETTNDSADQSQPSTDESRLSTAKRNACAR